MKRLCLLIYSVKAVCAQSLVNYAVFLWSSFSWSLSVSTSAVVVALVVEVSLFTLFICSSCAGSTTRYALPHCMRSWLLLKGLTYDGLAGSVPRWIAAAACLPFSATGTLPNDMLAALLD